MTVPRIGVTLGDPGGVGPEIVLKVLAGRCSLPPASIIVFGDSRIVAGAAASLGLSFTADPWRESERGKTGIYLYEVGCPDAERALHRPDARNGDASFRFFEAAAAAARGGRLDAVVTGPVSSDLILRTLVSQVNTSFLKSCFRGFHPECATSKWKSAILAGKRR